ncbi:unnamed protein product [Symbiodinium sp. CCMP2592]|nr:unnamed protein product [Symbiodinium sp. CCMP2592]
MIRCRRFRTLSWGYEAARCTYAATADVRARIHSIHKGPAQPLLPASSKAFSSSGKPNAVGSNICACVKKSLGSLRVAVTGSPVKRCPAVLVLPMGGSASGPFPCP